MGPGAPAEASSTRTLGAVAAPVRARAPTPANLRAAPKAPPHTDRARAPVRGLFVMTIQRLKPRALVAPNGPVTNSSGFDGARGSVPGVVRSMSHLMRQPRPPA